MLQCFSNNCQFTLELLTVDREYNRRKFILTIVPNSSSVFVTSLDTYLKDERTAVLHISFG